MSDEVSPSERGAGKGEVYFAARVIDLHRCRELSDNALEYLGRVVNDASKITKHRVAAARAILLYSQWREEREDRAPEALLRELLGSDAALLAWMDEHRPHVAARLAEKAAGALPLAMDHVNGRRDG